MKQRKTKTKLVSQKSITNKTVKILKEVEEIEYNLFFKAWHIQDCIKQLNSKKMESAAQLKDEYSDFLFWSHEMFVIVRNKLKEVEHSLQHLKSGE